MPARVVREDDKVLLEGVAGFSPGEYASSPNGCQARILQSLGESITYEDLICYSGFAFRVGVHEQMCPSAGHPCCGFECMEGSFRALPWRVEFFECFPWSDQEEDRGSFEARACQAIRESIDRGLPVHYGGEEDGLIVGYADEGRRWWCVHPYHEWGARAFWHDQAEGFAGGKWPWGIVVWTEPKPESERTSERELTLAALKQAVEMWKTEMVEAYYVGEKAYESWLSWLRDVEAGAVEDPKGGMQGNGWCFDVLIHGRRIAGGWLRQRADLFEGEAAAELGKAAAHYARVADICERDLECSWDLAPGPERFDEWDSSKRQDQISRLEAAREHDRAAIASIEKALYAIDE